MWRTLAMVATVTSLAPACSVFGTLKDREGDRTTKAAADPNAADTVGAVPGQDVAKSNDRSRLPKRIVVMVETHYTAPHVRKNVLRKLAAEEEAFSESWEAYRARAEEVEAVLEEVGRLEKERAWSEARARLERLITPAERDGRGRMELGRSLIEPIDAEVPAVFALVRVARAQEDFHRMVEAAADLYARRRVGDDRDEELSIWIAARQLDMMRSLASLNGEPKAYIESLLEKAHHAKQAGAEMATGFIGSLAELGVVPGSVEAGGGAERGSWALLRFYGLGDAEVRPGALSWSKRTTWREPYDCVVTSRIDSINPVTGKVVYAKECKYRRKSRLVTLKAKLAGDLPAWIDSAPQTQLRVLGRVERAGPRWRLARVSVPDLRFLEGVVAYPWRSPF